MIILPQCIMSLIRKVTALVAAVILMIVGFDEINLPDPDGAEVVGKTRYVLLDAKVSSQGVTNDGKYYYFSGNKHLGKADIKTGEMIRTNFYAIPKALRDKGCNHIGGLSYHNGYVYAAIEDGPDYNNSFIALYDAETLKFTGKYYELPHELHLEGVPWCEVDEENGYLYTAEWSNAVVLNVFDLEKLEFVKTIPLSEPVDRIQGAALYGGKLYLSCDEENDSKRILSLDVKTGEVETAFARNVGKVFEAEDITITVDEQGPVLHVLDRGERRESINLTDYRMTK